MNFVNGFKGFFNSEMLGEVVAFLSFCVLLLVLIVIPICIAYYFSEIRDKNENI